VYNVHDAICAGGNGQNPPGHNPPFVFSMGGIPSGRDFVRGGLCPGGFCPGGIMSLIHVQDVVIASAVRTPVGLFLGSLTPISATRLGAVAVQAAVERAGGCLCLFVNCHLVLLPSVIDSTS